MTDNFFVQISYSALIDLKCVSRFMMTIVTFKISLKLMCVSCTLTFTGLNLSVLVLFGVTNVKNSKLFESHTRHRNAVDNNA